MTDMSAPHPPHGRPRSIEEVVSILATMNDPRLAELVTSFQPRASDVFISTYPKCGTTWLQQIVHGLRTGGSMDFDDISLVVPWLEMSPLLGIEPDAEQPGTLRAFKTHLGWNLLPRGATYIYVLRDPGDVLVSYYHFLNGTLFERDVFDIEVFARELFLPGLLPAGAYWEHLRGWWPHHGRPDVFALSFEQLKRDLAGMVRALAAFLGIEDDPALLSLVTEQAGFAFMRAHDSKFNEHTLTDAMERLRGMEPGVVAHPSKVRAGETGASARELSAETRAALERRWQHECAPLGLPSYQAAVEQLEREHAERAR